VQWLNPIDLGALERQVLVTDNGNTQLDDDYAVMRWRNLRHWRADRGRGGIEFSRMGKLFLAGKKRFHGRHKPTGAARSASWRVQPSRVAVDLDAADGAKFLVSGTNVVLGELSGERGQHRNGGWRQPHREREQPGFRRARRQAHDDAALYLADAGNVPNATIGLAGLFEHTPGITAASTSVADLFGDGTIALGTKRLAVSDAQGGTFSGQITGTGAFGVSGGTLFLDFPDGQLITANIFAETGGKLSLTGGTMDTDQFQPVCAVGDRWRRDRCEGFDPRHAVPASPPHRCGSTSCSSTPRTPPTTSPAIRPISG